ncbi:hypothetical protein ACHAXT_004903 [Thalassiosira profunda]
MMKAASKSDNYYSAATATLSTSSAASPSPPNGSFPNWWPASDSIQKYISFADRIAHVIVPTLTSGEDDDAAVGESNDSNNTSLTCGDVVQWVLSAAKERNENDQSLSNIATQSKDGDTRMRIEDEWREGESVSTALKVLDPAFRHDPALLPQNVSEAQPNLSAAELIALGSVWRLPYSATKSNVDRFDPSNGIKPTRLNVGDFNKTVHPGDYFRVHFDPRRFVDANLFDWSTADGDVSRSSGKPGVIVAQDDDAGYLIINKPPNIPVHARVDNLLENVASSVGRALWVDQRRESMLSNADVEADEGVDATTMNRNQTKRKSRKQKTEQLIYVATPQRLDQNTSGLLVVATKKSFAAYFAKLLRTKTSGQLQQLSPSRSSSCGVHKAYRCLVCIAPQNGASMASAVERLKQFTVMKHFLEPSIRAPKRFDETVPDDAENPSSWAECLLRITSVAEVCTVVGNAPSEQLATALWGYGKPDECIAVVECEIELLTGRTHQIRGQLAASGFPLVGDVQYGGAVPNTSDVWKARCKGRAESFLDSECLALQCCSLEFLDPLHTTKPDGTEKAKRSKSWSSFRLENAFWTQHVDRYLEKSSSLSSSEATSSLSDEAPVLKETGKGLTNTL